mmetsp:Transcript_58796/g.67009  ORF Transcript_58796/g.67009 Transcript_58796/m.67009 type:complete len:95 (-) Transcript_58796:234-518(-)
MTEHQRDEVGQGQYNPTKGEISSTKERKTRKETNKFNENQDKRTRRRSRKQISQREYSEMIEFEKEDTKGFVRDTRSRVNAKDKTWRMSCCSLL